MSNELNAAPATHTMKFPTAGKSSTVQVHVNGCNALNSGSAAKFARLPYSTEEVSDLKDRGFTVKFCACCK